MARRTSSPAAPRGPALLTMPREVARSRLTQQIEAGNALRERQINNSDEYKQIDSDYDRWRDYCAELLMRMFTTSEYSMAFTSAWSGTMPMFTNAPHLNQEIRIFRENIDTKINSLRSLLERLDIIDEDPAAVRQEVAVAGTSASAAFSGENHRVFVVHGRDDGAKTVVARFLERCGLEAVILHEQADRGRTIIEKFEQESDVGFAVVVLTADDVGGRADASGEACEPLQARARQNVVLELGFFIGRLGRSRVCALKRDGLEMPSDYSGVVYTPFNGSDDGWKLSLARELKAAGYDIDLNQALS